VEARADIDPRPQHFGQLENRQALSHLGLRHLQALRDAPSASGRHRASGARTQAPPRAATAASAAGLPRRRRRAARPRGGAAIVGFDRPKNLPAAPSSPRGPRPCSASRHRRGDSRRRRSPARAPARSARRVEVQHVDGAGDAGRARACWCALVTELSCSSSEHGALGGLGVRAGTPRDLAQLVDVDRVATAALIEARASRPARGVARPPVRPAS
jgi:hypothetical protein